MTTISGVKWLKAGEFKDLPIAAVQGQVLCERHNNALSPLDVVGLKFFQMLEEIESDLMSDGDVEPEKRFLVNGNDFERWMLKVLCGGITSGYMNHTLGPEGSWAPPEDWVRLLFGEKTLPPGLGLYITWDDGIFTKVERGIEIGCISNDVDGPMGVLVNTSKKRWVFMLNHVKDELVGGTPLAYRMLRPNKLLMIREGRARGVIFGWQGQHTVGRVVLTYSNSAA